MMMLYASEAAALAGLLPHKKRHEAISALWKRHDPTSYAAAAERNTDVPPLALRDRALEDPHVAKVAEAAKSLPPPKDSTEASVRAETLAAGLSKDGASYIRSLTYCSFGDKGERGVKKILKESCGYHDLYEEGKFFKAVLAEGVSFGGRIDCRTADTLIEIKNRVHGLFGKASTYEKVQCHCYMVLLGVEKAVLVEAFTAGEDESTSLGLHPVPFDPLFWNETVVPKLLQSAAFVKQLTQDEALQDRWIQSPRRGHFLAAWIKKN